MKRSALIGICCAVAGLIVGVFIASHALVEPLDLLAFPYRNEPVRTTERLEVMVGSSGDSFFLPVGTPLVYRHDAEGEPHFGIMLVGQPGVRIQMEAASEVEHLQISKPDQ